MNNSNSTPHFGQFIVRSQCGQLIVSSQSHDLDEKITEKYYRVFCEGWYGVETSQLFFGFQKKQLAERNAQVVLVQTQCGDVLGGLHWHIIDGEMWLRAAMVRPKYRGARLGAAMLAISLAHTYMISDKLPNPVAAIRVFQDGSENIRSLKTFERVGFSAEAGTSRTYLNFTQADTHLVHSAEIDMNNKHYIQSRKLIGSARVYDIARIFLADWTQRAAA